MHRENKFPLKSQALISQSEKDSCQMISKIFYNNSYLNSKRTKTKNENKLSSFNLDKYKAAKKQDSAKSLEESNLSSGIFCLILHYIEGEQEESSKSNDDKSQNNSCSSSSDSSKSSNSNEKISSSSVSHENGHNSSLIKVSEVQKYFPHMEMSHPIAVHNDKQHNKVQVNLPEVMNIPSYSEHLKHKNDVNQSKKSSQITIKSSLKSSSDANTMANASKKKSGNIESQTFSKKISGNIESQTFVIKPSTSITETPVLRRPFIQNNIKEQVHKIMHKEIVNNNDSVKKMQSVGDSSKSPPSAAKSPVIRTAKSPPVPSSRLPLRFKSPFSSIRGLYTRFKSPNPKKTVIGKTIKNSRNNFYNLIFSFSGG